LRCLEGNLQSEALPPAVGAAAPAATAAAATATAAGQASLSVVVPAYNEERRLEAGLSGVLSFLRRSGLPFEVIVVDDGSTDATPEIARRFAAADARVRVLSHERNLGKGAAVRTGVLAAGGEYVIFTDADLSTPIESADTFLHHLSNGSDVVVGNRRMSQSRLEKRQGRLREFLGRIFTRLTRLLLGSPVTDQTCGFKGFKRRAAVEIFTRQRLTGWAFDAEILHIAARRDFRVRQVPVRWRDEEGSKVRVLRACLTSGLGLLRIWVNGTAGRYS